MDRLTIAQAYSNYTLAHKTKQIKGDKIELCTFYKIHRTPSKDEYPLPSDVVTSELIAYYAIHNHSVYGRDNNKKLCPICNASNIKAAKEEKEKTPFRQPHKKSIPKRNAKRVKKTKTKATGGEQPSKNSLF